MKKFFLTLIALIICTAPLISFAYDPYSPTCIMLRFSNSTRYKNVDSASVLSDLVIEKLLASGRFNLRETKPIDEDIEARLYDLKTRELWNLTTSLHNKNLNALFEGQGFNETQAQSISSADVGQIISPAIVSEIGRKHGAEYIIQGNVINLGNGNFFNEEAEIVDSFTDKMLGVSVDQKVAGVGVQTDLRIIKAATGEIVWRKIVTGKKTTKLTSVGAFKLGTAKLNSDLYNQAMEDAAQKIYDALIEDFKVGKILRE